MARPFPPIEVARTEQRVSGFKHVSVFLAQAFEQQAAEQAKDAAYQVPPGDSAEQNKQL